MLDSACELRLLDPRWLCASLYHLDVRNNLLRTLPAEAARVPVVLLSGNPDLDVRGVDEATWRSYVAAKSQGTVAPSLFRLVLVGEEAAGKSTLLRALTHQTVDISHNLSTDGIDSSILSNFEPDEVKKSRAGSVKEAVAKKMKSRQSPRQTEPAEEKKMTQISIECYDFAGQEI